MLLRAPKHLPTLRNYVSQITMIPHHSGGRQVPVSQRWASNLDLFATILELVGTVADPVLPSRSFADALQGVEVDDDAVFAVQKETRVIRTRDRLWFKRLDQPGSPDLQDALYDLNADPGGSRNLIADPAHADTASQLARRVDVFFAQCARPEAELWRGGMPIQGR